MAKTAKKTVAAPAARTGKSVATTGRGKAVATTDNVDVMLLMKQDAGRGVSTAAEDNIIPLIYILQAQSPQALKQKPDYIKGATAGMLWPRGTKTLIDGEETGMPFIPVAFKKVWNEWGAERGDGFFGSHPYDAADENKGRPESSWVEDPKKPGKGKWEMENGHILVETRVHAGLGLIDDQWTGCVISMSGSNHTASRSWMGLMKNKRIPVIKDGEIVGYTDDRAPCFAYIYNMKTIAKSNDDGDWYGWQVEDGMGDGEVTFLPLLENGSALYRQARQLASDFDTGVKVADAPAERDDAGGTPPADDNDDIM